MLSYRHAFHAGNHADILKHATQIFILNSLRRKEKPFIYIDTHAGAGVYDLHSQQAQKTGESELAIQALWQQQNNFPELQDYFQCLKSSNSHKLRYYLGSPLITEHFLREQDRMALMELHPTDAVSLKKRLRKPKQTRFFQTDGFKQLIALTPPIPKRGLVLIDPPYEIKEDYSTAINALQEAHKRWATGIYAIWYPILARRDFSENFVRKIKQLGLANTVNIEMFISSRQNHDGMYGSGMIVVNAPWQLDSYMEGLLPKLSDTLSQDQQANWKVEWLAPPA